MSAPSATRKLTATVFAALMVVCCLAAPPLVGAAAALTAGAVFGVGAGILAVLALCLFVARRLRSATSR